MATDGVSLYYNPEFVDTLNSATLAGVLAHEVMHPALQHHVRRSGRDPRRWNEACDYAINPLLLDAGLSLPEGVLVDHRFRGMSAEQIYNLRESGSAATIRWPGRNEARMQELVRSDAPEEQNAPDSPSAPVTEGGIGQVLDAPLSDEGTPSVEEQARDWSVALNQAVTLSKQAGKVSCGPCTNSRRRGGGSSRLAGIAAQALVGHHPGRFELDAAEPASHLGRALSAWSRARRRRGDCDCCRLLWFGQCPAIAAL